MLPKPSVIEPGKMVMDRIVWTRLHTLVLVAVSIILFVAIGFAVNADEAGPGTGWKCYLNHVPGHLACFNTADGRRTHEARSSR